MRSVNGAVGLWSEMILGMGGFRGRERERGCLVLIRGFRTMGFHPRTRMKGRFIDGARTWLIGAWPFLIYALAFRCARAEVMGD